MSEHKFADKEAEKLYYMMEERRQKLNYAKLKKMCEVDMLGLNDMPVFLSLLASLVNDEDVKQKILQVCMALTTVVHIDLRNKLDEIEV